MALQKVFKSEYLQLLKNNINPEDYLKEQFPYDATQVRQLANVRAPEGLLDKLIPTPDGDLQSAIAIYEAYPNLTPIFAQKDDLWVYLTHADLFPYVQKRWKIKELTQEELLEQIEHHWFKDKFQFMRTSFAGFWWIVRLTRDENNVDDPYELTRYLFKNTEFRTSSFGELPLIRHEAAMKGILEFVRDHEDIFDKGFSAKARYIRHTFNIIGGYKNLSSLPKEFFYKTLEDRLDTIKEVHDASSVKAGSAIYNK